MPVFFWIKAFITTEIICLLILYKQKICQFVYAIFSSIYHPDCKYIIFLCTGLKKIIMTVISRWPTKILLVHEIVPVVWLDEQTDQMLKTTTLVDDNVTICSTTFLGCPSGTVTWSIMPFLKSGNYTICRTDKTVFLQIKTSLDVSQNAVVNNKQNWFNGTKQQLVIL